MSAYVHLIGRFRALGPGDRRMLVSAWLLLPPVAVMLRILGIRRLLSLVERFGRPREFRAADPPDVERLARLIAAAARWAPLPRNCLRESIVLVGLLRRRGVAALLRVGVRKEKAADLEAHAWAEVDGLPVAAGHEAGGRRYFAFPQPLLPPAPTSR